MLMHVTPRDRSHLLVALDVQALVGLAGAAAWTERLPHD